MSSIYCLSCNAQFGFDATTNTPPANACPSCGVGENWWANVPEQPVGQQPCQMPYPQPKAGMSGTKIAVIILCIVFGFVVLGGVLVGVLAVAVVPKLEAAKKELELPQVKDQVAVLHQIETNQIRKRKLQSLNDTKGQELWAKMIEKKIVPQEIMMKLVSYGSKTEQRPTALGSHIESNCSYTLPKADMLREVMSSSGSKRCVFITFNSRNWNNYDGEVVVMWSDSRAPEFLTFEYFRDNWNITEGEWADPAGKLFGIKAPFQHTYE